MLSHIADGGLIHETNFLRGNAVVVHSAPAGDPPESDLPESRLPSPPVRASNERGQEGHTMAMTDSGGEPSARRGRR